MGSGQEPGGDGDLGPWLTAVGMEGLAGPSGAGDTPPRVSFPPFPHLHLLMAPLPSH